ncbi:MAG: hypothetical protein N3F67_00555 [Acidilobaceae archaeon]|nr:hypothetical protein [Acidilobaceae archaeon]
MKAYVQLAPYGLLALSGFLALLSLLQLSGREAFLLPSLALSLATLLFLLRESPPAASLALVSLALVSAYAAGLSPALPLSVLSLSALAYLISRRLHTLVLSLGALVPLLDPLVGLMAALTAVLVVVGIVPGREQRGCPFRIDSKLVFYGAVIASAGILLGIAGISWAYAAWLTGLLILLSGLIVPLGPSGQRPS